MKTIRNAVLVFALLAVPALAHHSFTAEFDTNKPVTLKGALTLMKWSNPHGWLYIDVIGPDGKKVNWGLETQGANGLLRRGWRKEDLKAGTILLVKGWQARNGSNTANITSVTFENGKTLFAGSSNPDAKEQ